MTEKRKSEGSEKIADQSPRALFENAKKDNERLSDKIILPLDESLAGGDELPEAVLDALTSLPIEYGTDQSGQSIMAYPGIKYISREMRTGGGALSEDSYTVWTNLYLSYYASSEEAQEQTQKTLSEREQIIKKRAEDKRLKQELDEFRADFGKRLSAAKQRIAEHKRIAEEEFNYGEQRERLLKAIEAHLATPLDKISSNVYYYDSMARDGSSPYGILQMPTMEYRSRVEEYLEKISNTADLDDLVKTIREERRAKENEAQARKELWKQAKDLAHELSQETRGLADRVYSKTGRDENNPLYQQALRVANDIYAIGHQGHRRNEYGELQAIDPNILVSQERENYASKIAPIAEKLRSLEQEVKEIKANIS